MSDMTRFLDWPLIFKMCLVFTLWLQNFYEWVFAQVPSSSKSSFKNLISEIESTSCLLYIFHRFVMETVGKRLILLATKGLMQEMLLPEFSGKKQWKVLPLTQITLTPWWVAKIRLPLSPAINSFHCPCVFVLTMLKHFTNCISIHLQLFDLQSNRSLLFAVLR